MRDGFTKNICVTVGLILGLLFLSQVHGLVGQSRSGRLFRKVISGMRNGGLNREDFDALAGGYYEGLQKDAGPMGLPHERDDVRFRDDFLRYEFRPNVKRSYGAGMRITNSLGMPNPEYGYQKPPHTRRIALLGDSISVGPYGQDYVALLEKRLNQANLTPEIQRFEVLNFATYGYSVVQTMDVALDKATQFQPDVYLVALTGLEIDRKAGSRTHIGRLIVSGTDLKYDFLRNVVAQAGVRPTDHLATIQIKLARYVLPVTRWALEQIRDHAESQGAQMVIVLVPAPIDPEFIDSDFNLLRKATDSLGVPVVDLRNTFRSVNLADVQVVPLRDVHPNVRGHEMLAEDLYAGLRAQPRAWTAIVGGPTESAQHASPAARPF